jgi:hypothetical protein
VDRSRRHFFMHVRSWPRSWGRQGVQGAYSEGSGPGPSVKRPKGSAELTRIIQINIRPSRRPGRAPAWIGPAGVVFPIGPSESADRHGRILAARFALGCPARWFGRSTGSERVLGRQNRVEPRPCGVKMHQPQGRVPGVWGQRGGRMPRPPRKALDCPRRLKSVGSNQAHGRSSQFWEHVRAIGAFTDESKPGCLCLT